MQLNNNININGFKSSKTDLNGRAENTPNRLSGQPLSSIKNSQVAMDHYSPPYKPSHRTGTRTKKPLAASQYPNFSRWRHTQHGFRR